MNVKKVRAIYYSAAGTTEKIVKTLGMALAEELGVPFESNTFNTPQEREVSYSYASDEVVIVGSPTYAGKMPNKLMPTFRENLTGNGATAVAVVLYGNRSYDNSLAEMYDILKEKGFSTVAAAACVAEHAMVDQLASGRPNAEDLQAVKTFALRVAEKLRSGAWEELTVPGDGAAPYYVPKDEHGEPAKFLKAKPLTDLEKCVGCGLCAQLCPMGSINPENTAEVTGVCIKCHSCVRYCPMGAKYFDDPALLSHKVMLAQNFTAPKESEFFL